MRAGVAQAETMAPVWAKGLSSPVPLLFPDFPPWSPPPMTGEEFWNVVERPAAEHPDADPGWCVGEITADLARRPAADILAFDRHMWGHLRRSYRWDLWGAAFLLRGGCSDDGFDYFRAWLISRGRAVYEAALADPDSLAGLFETAPSPREGWRVELEELMSAAPDAYRQVAGGEIALENEPDEPWPDLGDSWDFDDDAVMRRRYPRLWLLCETDGT